jgi:hypothetical protein
MLPFVGVFTLLYETDKVHITQFVASLQSMESKEERRHLLRKRGDTEKEGMRGHKYPMAVAMDCVRMWEAAP